MENCFPFHLNTKNKFLMSKWRIQRLLIQRALEICKKCLTAQTVTSHFLCLLEHLEIDEIICLLSSDKHQ